MAEVLFGGALTEMICRWKPKVCIDLRKTGRAMARAMLVKLERVRQSSRKLPLAADCSWPFSAASYVLIKIFCPACFKVPSLLSPTEN